jgi:arginine-tRNA-protein transferase
MNSLNSAAPLAFFATSPQPCPYLPNRTERRLVTDLSRRDAVPIHDALSQAGFRRSHTLAYAPICQGCSACMPVRVHVPCFVPDRSHRRVLARNSTVLVSEVPAQATSEQYNLFAQYQKLRHRTGEMAKMRFYDYQMLIEQTPVKTSVLEARESDGKLCAVSIVDHLVDGISAVYSFYDAQATRRSLGTYMILKMIEKARLGLLQYLYLGFWIAQATNMAYKARFKPLECFTPDGWKITDQFA